MSTTPKLYNVLSFDGNDSYVEISDPFEHPGQFTISLWVKPRVVNDGQHHAIIGHQVGSDPRTRKPGLWLTPEGSGLHFDSYDPTGHRHSVARLDNIFEQDKWVHIAWVKRLIQSEIYKDGTLAGSWGAPVGVNTTNSSPRYWIGKVDTSWDGEIAEVRIWNVARSQAEIEEDMRRRLTGTEPGLARYLPLDEGEGAIARDRTGKDRGKIVGATWTKSDLPLEGPAGTGAQAGSITDVVGLSVGHDTLAGRPTGCTVILAPNGATAGVDVRGAAPGTRETDLLRPENLVQRVHAIVLSGGSAFGLAAATGAMRWLEEQGIGFDVGVAKVPIVPAAVLFDLPVGDAAIRPDAESGYRAAQAAMTDPVREGDVGAGAGATVGKLFDMKRAMKAGIGSASFKLPTPSGSLVVGALAAVNAYGDVVDPATGRVIAGVRTPDGAGLADARELIRSGTQGGGIGEGANTTLVVVATNAKLTKTEATKVAQMAHDGLARAISPVHTPFDGDIVFALATGTLEGPADLLTIGALAADAAANAIVRAALQSRGLPGLPSASALGTAP